MPLTFFIKKKFYYSAPLPVIRGGSAAAFFEQRPINCGGEESFGVMSSTCYKYEQGKWLDVIISYLYCTNDSFDLRSIQ